jgi:hypothetical protein
MICGYPGAPTSNSSLCPGAPGPDSDFAMAPTFVPAALGEGTTGNDSVVVGQKNGNLYNINAVTGDIQWMINIGVDTSGNWLSWGISVDNTSIYFTSINYGAKTWTLEPSGVSINNSAWGAVSLDKGDYLWETACPGDQLAYSPPGVVNDLVFVGQSGSSTANITGSVLALSKKNGAILTSWPLDSVQDGGIMVSGGFMMFGTGYAYRNPFNSGSFYVFGLPDAIAEAKAQLAAPKASPTPSSPVASPSATTKKAAASRIYDEVMSNIVYPMVALTVLIVWFS